MNPLKALQEFRQSVWLDNIRRSLITSGELRKLVEEDGLRGVTSNPSIFEKAIAGSTDYTADLAELPRRKDLDAKQMYEQLAIRDIQLAADVMRQVYDQTRKRDGYVSLEVSPDLAHDTAGTVAEARRLWGAVGRENVMIKVPATPEGIPAIRQLIGAGINVNVTLLFAREAYDRVAEAYIDGLEAFASAGGDIGSVASVASFFVSRIDTLVDGQIAERLKQASDTPRRELLQGLMGKIAIVNAKLAYQSYKDRLRTARWQALAGKGAQSQRLLWASTSTKNPAYRDVIYCEELIGPDTVNTMPPATLDAFRDHGKPRASLEENVDRTRETMEALERAGVSMKKATDQLLDEGVKLFSEAFGKLLTAVEKRCQGAIREAINRQSHKLPADLDAAVKATLAEWHAQGKMRRLWTRDATLWTGEDEASWLGWLGIAEDQLARIDHLRRIANDVKKEGFSHVLLLGMGGSSLCPEVLRMTFGKSDGYPELHVLDSTDPGQVKASESAVDLNRTIFIVSSKSGSTLEPNIFKQYFFERVAQALGRYKAGSRFIAITDPGSKLQQEAEADGFRHIFHGVPSIGGRYSALSDFGMVPAAIMGIDVRRFLDQANEMAHSCASCVPTEENPAAVLGAIMGLAAARGRDKVTLVASPGIRGLGAWLEQLLAESTGKNGKGLIPVDREPIGGPAVYGDDRLFAYLRLESAPDTTQDAAVAALEAAGQPVVRISVDHPYDLGEEFFRWEMATGVAGSILGINPFDQPDVEASKIATRKLTSEYEATGSLQPEQPFLAAGGIKLFADERNLAELRRSVQGDRTLAGALRAHLSRIGAGDYFALLAYIPMTDENEGSLQRMRLAVRDDRRVATCLGFGPRFLHSTGQAYKGGPNTGVFLQITCDDALDVPVPGRKYTFGVVKAAQARGDLQVLSERGRRALRVHLGSNVRAGLQTLGKAIVEALGG